ncbi:hypothetical protein JMJ56_29420 [Belnapia sp. T18]|uniref:Uncharacterized protein n=1 Tax=Belnapia arida TaxID=2804533 RepID=A0ABS1UBP1_9PROT|nr:DUF6516 family protein [Belnapia arida]MBL6082101.1 hypothetical protein [Belnapia arida]
MKAVPIFRERLVIGSAELVEIVIWQVPTPVPPSDHDFKYRLAYVRDRDCVVRYDNERGKGDHKHLSGWELPYTFTSVEQLLSDFEADIIAIRGEPI